MSVSYLYPPRPEYKVSIDTLKKYDNGQYIAQPKLNGSNGVLILDREKWELWNRHRQKMTLYNDKIQFGKLYRGNGEMVLNGEYLNKNKKDGTGKPFNHKFIIFDILKYNGEVLTGKTFVERIALLDELYPCKNDKDEFICGLDVEDIYRVKNIQNGFEEKYKDLVKIDMYEGLVLKRKNAKLEPMFREGNNSGSMVKVRKETKNYFF